MQFIGDGSGSRTGNCATSPHNALESAGGTSPLTLRRSRCRLCDLFEQLEQRCQGHGLNKVVVEPVFLLTLAVCFAGGEAGQSHTS